MVARRTGVGGVIIIATTVLLRRLRWLLWSRLWALPSPLEARTVPSLGSIAISVGRPCGATIVAAAGAACAAALDSTVVTDGVPMAPPTAPSPARWPRIAPGRRPSSCVVVGALIVEHGSASVTSATTIAATTGSTATSGSTSGPRTTPNGIS